LKSPLRGTRSPKRLAETTMTYSKSAASKAGNANLNDVEDLCSGIIKPFAYTFNGIELGICHKLKWTSPSE